MTSTQIAYQLTAARIRCAEACDDFYAAHSAMPPAEAMAVSHGVRTDLLTPRQAVFFEKLRHLNAVEDEVTRLESQLNSIRACALIGWTPRVLEANQ